MRRDMELVRKILLQVEESDDILTPPIQINGYDDKVVNDHIVLMHEAGLLEAFYTEKMPSVQEVDGVRKS